MRVSSTPSDRTGVRPCCQLAAHSTASTRNLGKDKYSILFQVCGLNRWVYKRKGKKSFVDPPPTPLLKVIEPEGAANGITGWQQAAGRHRAHYLGDWVITGLSPES